MTKKTWAKLIVLLLVVLVLLILIVGNRQPATFWLFHDFTMPLSILLVVAALMGLAGGVLAAFYVSGRRRK